jgi:hypothetical protein
MASPFRIPISWALAAQGQQMLHGAAITHKGSAALLCGNGGAGKSTTALAAALHGFGYVGDDYVAVDSVSRRVSLIYRTAKLLPATLAMLPRLAPLICNRDRMDREKGVLFLDGTQWELVPSAPLKCLLLPRIAQEGEPRVSPASRAEAIQALLPSTVGGLMGGTSATAGHMLRLASSLPALHLHLTPDIGALMVLLRQTLERYS